MQTYYLQIMNAIACAADRQRPSTREVAQQISTATWFK